MGAAEHVLAIAEDVRDPGVGGDLDRAPRFRVGDATHDHHAEDVSRGAIGGGECGDIEIEDQLAVDREERLVAAIWIEEWQRVPQATTVPRRIGSSMYVMRAP